MGRVQSKTARHLAKNHREFRGSDRKELNHAWALLGTGSHVAAQAIRPRRRLCSDCLFSWFLKQVGLHRLSSGFVSRPGRLWRAGTIDFSKYLLLFHKSTNCLHSSEGTSPKPRVTDAPGGRRGSLCPVSGLPVQDVSAGAKRPLSFY